MNLNARHIQVLNESNNLMIMGHTLSETALINRTETNWPVSRSSASHCILSSASSRADMNAIKFAIKHSMGIYKDTVKLYVPIPQMKKHEHPVK